MQVSAKQSQLITRVNKLRAQAFALRLEVGASFAIGAIRGWKAGGLTGMASACWTLAQEVQDIPGAWDVYDVAQRLAADLTACG
jgi:hypothetical protein